MAETGTSIARITVVGAGAMGAQIAHQIALHGFEVALVDRDPVQLQRAAVEARGHLQRRVAKGAMRDSEMERALARVTPSLSLDTAVAGTDLVIEAVVEDLEVKRQLFQELDRLAPASAILATNSSTMTVSELTADLPGRERTLAMHFFNPALVMRLVEIAPAPYTRSGLCDEIARFTRAIDRDPVVMSKEIAGLLVNRVLWALRREAMWLADSGYAAPGEIDRAVKLGLKHPMGPFELADFNGLDVVLLAQRHRYALSGDERDRPPAILERLVAAGDLGRKSGRGFYDYPALDRQPEEPPRD